MELIMEKEVMMMETETLVTEATETKESPESGRTETELQNHAADAVEAQMLPTEIRSEMKGLEDREVIVFGNPETTGLQLDYQQGDNAWFALGNCGLVTISNCMNLCGVSEASEDVLTKHAIENDQCIHGWFVAPEDRGGTYVEDVCQIFEDFGLTTEVVRPDDANGSIEDLAMRIENGQVGAFKMNSGIMWNEPDLVGINSADHWVTPTGTVRDADTGELLGITVCDSGSGNPCNFISVEQMEDCYVNAVDSAAVFISNCNREI